jgi:hypothetical protein
MIIQESIKVLNLLRFKLYQEFQNAEYDCVKEKIKRDIDAIDVASEALEKQTPKQPDYEGDGYDDKGEFIYDTMYCPNCGKDFEVDYYNGKCCDECGQMFDRSLEIN